MRLTPKSVFLGIVALGLPFAVSLGWTLGTQDQPAAVVTMAPGGADGIGSAPVPAATSATGTAPVISRSSTKEVAVIERVPPSPRTRRKPSSAAPSTPPTVSPAPSTAVPPVATPTQADDTPAGAAPSPSASSTSAPTGLGGLVGKH
ncbi:hypothetical protein [Actinoplanes sp. TFC3]|uniref:hypothetical protein n=1 Tax=Actinoplanes sp. TFC3 TaxID=1710355 RepID=UPI00082C1529|nr:hypothetical protein [Actinoplanes sp. TFC3]